MFTTKGITYSDAGKYLKAGTRITYQTNISTSEITEVVDTLDNFTLQNTIVTWSNGERATSLIPNGTYTDYKTKLIKSRYSNDDQIAIMLNKDSGNPEDALAYQRMQEWREYCSQIATKIIETIQNK